MQKFASAKSLRDFSEEVTPTRLRMHRQRDKSTCLVLVEGESDLVIFDSRLFNDDACKIWQMNGKKGVLSTINQIREWGLPGVIAILDADFDRIIGNTQDSNDVFYCDGHDAEIMMSLTNAFDDLVRIAGEKDKLDRAKKKTGRSILDMLLDMGAPIGAAMLIDRENDWNLSFKELDYVSFIDSREFICDEDKLAECLAKQKPALCIDSRTFAKLIRKKVRDIDNPKELCRGHDFSVIFAMCFAKRNTSDFLSRAKDIEDALRIGFRHAEFETTELYRKLIDWQRNNRENIYRVI